jgi:hypothetical protein
MCLLETSVTFEHNPKGIEDDEKNNLFEEFIVIKNIISYQDTKKKCWKKDWSGRICLKRALLESEK